VDLSNSELLDSQFHHVDLFSELSRNMTPSSSSFSDLFEATEVTTIQEDIESSDTEADNLQNEVLLVRHIFTITIISF
jgi:hypothetical protein